MYRLTSRLLLYSDLGQDSILLQLAEIFRDWEGKALDKPSLSRRIFVQVKRLLDLATQYGFDENLWQDYLTFLLLTNENSFSLTAERVGAGDGSVNHFAKADLNVFRQLFFFDFGPLEQDLQIDCFTTLTHYRALEKKEKNYYRHVSQQVRTMSRKLAGAQDESQMFAYLTEFYGTYGVGMFGLNRAFRIRHGDHGVEFLPIHNTDKIMLRDLVGYDLQKRQLTDNTEAFLRGQPANNALLYGDAGTGKSSSIKALINEYYDSGLRMIELYKHQFQDLSNVIGAIKGRNYRFIIYMDDLSFEENEVEYKFLKAVMEGGVESKPDNVLIYATSNRRHLIKETWSDRSDMEHENDIHRSDTMEEKLSLAARFGCSINYSAPDRKLFRNMVLELAHRQLDNPPPEEELLRLANQWELRHGGISGRTAQQFINYLAGRECGKDGNPG